MPTKLSQIFCALVTCTSLIVLTGCENGAAAYQIDSKDNAITLVREQSAVWSNTVKQYLVVANMPICQSRIQIFNGTTGEVNIELYQLKNNVWALHQGTAWFVANSLECTAASWSGPTGEKLELIGSFNRKAGELTFTPSKSPASS